MRVASQALYFVYILRSLKDNNYYTGSTSNLVQRIKAHNSGKVASTQKRKPFELVYFEEHQNLIDVRQREKFLKTYQGGKSKYRLVENFSKELLSSYTTARGPAKK